ncbi:MAG: bifunctional precorrin-2 dehydrogenase/sirohydrochlorin ferrochelatase [Candidatus Omnitrophica bacterium]|nr:bifunctional precorrin-2 dehydrogenase/sirohydrochlorin ferrochelatase [Candidatus Omnitrophota bacterium]
MPPKTFYTACLNIRNKPVLVVGGGEVARRKAAALCDCGAKATVVSPKLESVLEYMAFQKEIVWIERHFEPGDVEGMFMVIAATDSREVNRAVSDLCHKKNILCNVADAVEECSFIAPSTIERGPLTIAVSTSGISPALAASIRQELELAYGEEYGAFLEMFAALRPHVIETFPSPHARQKIYERMIASRALSLIRNGMNEQAERELKEIIYDAKNDRSIKNLGQSIPIVNPPE